MMSYQLALMYLSFYPASLASFMVVNPSLTVVVLLLFTMPLLPFSILSFKCRLRLRWPP